MLSKPLNCSIKPIKCDKYNHNCICNRHEVTSHLQILLALFFYQYYSYPKFSPISRTHIEFELREKNIFILDKKFV